MFVSNTSTLVLLAKISCLESFLETVPVLFIPKQVKDEALFERESYYARLIQGLIGQRKILVKEADEAIIRKVREAFRLESGEAAAYALFKALKEQALLTDDGELIKLCRLEKIQFICAMAVVITLFNLKKISRLEALEKLRILKDIGRYSQNIYEHFKSEVK